MDRTKTADSIQREENSYYKSKRKSFILLLPRIHQKQLLGILIALNKAYFPFFCFYKMRFTEGRIILFSLCVQSKARRKKIKFFISKSNELIWLLTCNQLFFFWHFFAIVSSNFFSSIIYFEITPTTAERTTQFIEFFNCWQIFTLLHFPFQNMYHFEKLFIWPRNEKKITHA